MDRSIVRFWYRHRAQWLETGKTLKRGLREMRRELRRMPPPTPRQLEIRERIQKSPSLQTHRQELQDQFYKRLAELDRVVGDSIERGIRDMVRRSFYESAKQEQDRKQREQEREKPSE